MIKKIVLIAAIGTMGLLWGSSEVTIQVINAVKEKSITPDFDKKLAKSGLPIHKVVEGGRYIVTLGTYKDAKSAQSALKKARGIVSKEAFIRPVNRDQVAVASHGTAKEVAVEHVTVNQPVVAHVEVKEMSDVAASKQDHVVVVQVKPVTVEAKDSHAAMVVASSSSEKKEAYMNEIAEAISFYRNSPYHRFEPVMLQQ